MKKYGLRTKDGEIINKIDSTNITEAINKFAELKKLEAVDLLKIFIVMECKN